MLSYTNVKVIHVSTSDRLGGAAIAAKRLNDVFNEYNIDSKLLIRDRTLDSNKILDINAQYGNFKKLGLHLISSGFNVLVQKMLRPIRGTFSLSYGFYRISELDELKTSDIVYIHWCNQSFISIKEIERILKIGKPTIIVLHDMWYLTGGCHHSLGCEGLKNCCYKCPAIGRKSFSWMAKIQLKLKKRLSQYNNLSIVSPSFWMDRNISDLSIYKNNRHLVIPNVLPIETFKPLDKKISRSILDLPRDKKLVMFLADGGTSNPYKGWQYLKDSLKLLNQSKNIELVVVGNEVSEIDITEIGMKIHSFGKVTDEITLPIFYSAVDIFVTSSLADNAPQVVVEAQSCGCPVIGFRVGGIPDMMLPSQIENLVQPKNARALADKIMMVLGEERTIDERDNMHLEIEKVFGPSSVITKHKQLWEQFTPKFQ